jgi:hypothetical protein
MAFHYGQDGFAAPDILFYHLHGAVQNDADVFDALALHGYVFALFVVAHKASQTLEHGAEIAAFYAGKQRRADYFFKMI